MRSGNFQIDTETGSDDEERGIYKYMNESLTPTNRKLLKEARQHAKAKDYSFKGYTINGEVRVRKSTTSEPIIIEGLEDIGKNVWTDCLKMFEKIPRIFKIQVFYFISRDILPVFFILFFCLILHRNIWNSLCKLQ